MEQQIKKIVLYSFVTMLLVLFIGISFFFKGGGNALGLNLPGALSIKKDLVGTNASPYNFIGSTTAYLPYAVATSTSVMSGDYAAEVLNLKFKFVNATNTAITLTITPTYSNDDGCASTTDSSINWFTAIDANSTNNKGATTTSFAASATTEKSYSISDLTTQCTKLVISPSLASSTLYLQGLLK